MHFRGQCSGRLFRKTKNSKDEGIALTAVGHARYFSGDSDGALADFESALHSPLRRVIANRRLRVATTSVRSTSRSVIMVMHSISTVRPFNGSAVWRTNPGSNPESN